VSAVSKGAARSRAARTWETIRRGSPRVLLRDFWNAAAANRLLVYSSAVAYRGLIATIPLILLGLALLGAFGLQDTWRNSIQPAIDPHVEKPVAAAINFSVNQIFAGNSASLIAFATIWALWNVSVAVSMIMQALNEIHDTREARPLKIRAVTALALGTAVATLVILAVIVMSAAPLINGSVLHTVFGVGRWLVAPALLILAVTLLFRFAPAERPEVEWASAGSALVVLVWLVTTSVFVWWVTVANYKSATGNLAVLLTVTLYVFITSTIFLSGAQLDELLRRKAR
jgi:membrane protein